jgi:uncharacterized OsmC-like protein
VVEEEVFMPDIKGAIESAVLYLTDHPDEAHYTDSAATAILEDGLRCRVEGPDRASVVTDMPESVGGGNAAPSPGWLFRAALASCVATLIAMESAREDISLDTLEATVDSESDDRGILAIDASVPSGPLSVRIRVRAQTRDERGAFQQVVDRAIRLCPVFDVATRAIPVTLEIGS